MTWYQIPSRTEKINEEVIFSEVSRDDSLLIGLSGITDKVDEYFYLKEESKTARTSNYNTRLEYEV